MRLGRQRLAALCSAILLFLGCAPQPAQQKHFLWVVKNKEHRVFVMGSIHLAPPELYPLPQIMEAAFDSTAALALEIDLSGGAGDSAASHMVGLGMLPPGESLWDLLDSATAAHLRHQLRDLGSSTETVQGLRPWFVALQLGAMALQKLGLEPALGVDSYFLGRAEDEGRPVLALESGEEQVAIFGDLPPEEDIHFLRQTLRELDSLPAAITSMFTAWKAGDTHALEAIVFSQGASPLLQERLYAQRNRKMAQKIHHWVNTGVDVLVIVGAAHMVGAESIPELLAREGLQVEQVRSLGH